MNLFQHLFDVLPPGIVIAAAIAMAAIVLLLGYEWLARCREERREECRAEEEADAEWEAKQAATRNKLPTALSIPAVVHVKQEPVRRAAHPLPAHPPKRAKRPNKSRARHK